MSKNEHDDDQPDSFEVIERLRSEIATIREQALDECEAIVAAEIARLWEFYPRPHRQTHR